MIGRPMRPASILCAIALSIVPVFPASRFDLSYFAKTARVSDPQISPDGKSIAIVVSRPNYVENRHHAQIVLVDVATGSQRTLSYERRGVSSPRWSPTGDRLAFLAMDTSLKPRTQLFIMPMSGGDALQITNAPAGVQQFAWRPDGTMIAYAASDE